MTNDSRLPIEVEVEPLSEARVTRLRSQVLAAAEAEARTRVTARQRVKRGRGTAVLAFAAAAAIAGVATKLATKVAFDRPAAAEARLVTTESASQFTIGESSLEVAPRSMVLVHGDDAHGVDVVLDRGGVTCEVAPRRGRPAFVVDAGEVRVRVVGTRFAVERDGSGARVHVDHGAVEVTSRGAVTMLHDGESWPSVSAAVLSQAPPAPTPTLAVAPATTAPAPVVASAPSAPATVASSPSRKHTGRHPAAAPPSEPQPAPQPPAPNVPVAATPSPAPAQPAPAPSPREQFESAARLEAAQPSRAADLYRGIADGGGSWAPNALFALARLESDRGRPADAKRLLQSYLARYPHGQNAEDARALLDRLP